MTISRRQEWLLRALLVLIGTAVACAVGGGAYLFLRYRAASQGAEFSSLAELKASLATADSRTTGRITLGSIIQSHPSDQIIYDLRPNLSVSFQGAPVQTNSCGMRERELPLVKPAGTFRIAVIGDSFTFGWGVTEQEAFPRQLEEILNSLISSAQRKETRAPGAAIQRVEVLNFGVPGYSPFQEVTTFEEKALPYQPDAVILFFIENDFGMPFFIRNLEQPQHLLAAANLPKLARAALTGDDDETADPPAAPKLPPEFDPNRALRKLAASADEHGVKVYLAINPKKNWSSIHRRLWILRDIHQIRFMNFYSEFDRMITARGYSKESLTLRHDQHPSPRKHRMLAEVMAPYFLDQVLPR